MAHYFCEIVAHNVIAVLVEELLNIGGHLHRLVLVRLESEGVQNGLQILTYLPAKRCHLRVYDHIVTFLRRKEHLFLAYAVGDVMELNLPGRGAILQLGRLVAHDSHVRESHGLKDREVGLGELVQGGRKCTYRDTQSRMGAGSRRRDQKDLPCGQPGRSTVQSFG